MSRIHDMGGRFGDGPVQPEAQDATSFAEEWHKRALAVTLACGSLGRWNLDMSRHARESLMPSDYACFSYYEKWMAALANLLVRQGLVSLDELTRGAADGPSPLAGRSLRAEQVGAVLAKGAPTTRESDIAQRFQPGDAVRTRRAANLRVPGGHTRLPGYAARVEGHIVRCHGDHILPDAHAHGGGEAPEPLYAVAFKAAALWAHPEHPRDEVVLDVWQSYLEPTDAP